MFQPPNLQTAPLRAGMLAGLVLAGSVFSGCAQELGGWYVQGLQRYSCSHGDRVHDCRQPGHPQQVSSRI